MPERSAGRAAAVIAAAAVVVLACADRSPEASGSATVAVRDSMGIRIVESARPACEAPWRLEPEPSVVLGAAEGPGTTFERIAEILVQSDGDIVVADASNEILFYESDGSHVRTVGGTGEGPGEFESLFKLFSLRGDSLLAIDMNRHSLLDEDGTFVKVRPSIAQSPSVVFQDGSYLVTPYAAGVDPLDEGRHRHRLVMRRIGPDGRTLGEFGPFPGWEVHVIQDRGRVYNMRVPFGRYLSMDTFGDLLYTGSQDRFEVEVRSPTGELLRLLRADVPDRKVTPAALAEVERQMRGPDPNPGRDRLVDEVLSSELHETFPAYGVLKVDRDGYLWAEEVPAAGPAPARWHVFAPDGSWACTVDMPDGFHLYQPGSDRVVGLSRDALDVDRVHVHEWLER